MAERLGIIEPQLCKLLLTTVAISMAATPALSNFSAWVADQVQYVCVCPPAHSRLCLLELSFSSAGWRGRRGRRS